MNTFILAVAFMAQTGALAQVETGTVATNTESSTVISSTGSSIETTTTVGFMDSTDATLSTITPTPTPITISSVTVSSSYFNSDCDADYIVDFCLSITTQKQLDCDPEDYPCSCRAYQAISTCFDNCPNDPRKKEFLPVISQYCELAQMPTTSMPSEHPHPTATRGRSSHATARKTGTQTADFDETKSTSGAVSNLVKAAGGALALAGAVAALF